jgi:Na+-transporting NADH:ubiquinone oxidoreductase subunit B
MDMKRTMTVVIIALMPALLFGCYNIGLQHTRAFGLNDWTLLHMFWFGFLKLLPMIIVSYMVGLGTSSLLPQ